MELRSIEYQWKPCLDCQSEVRVVVRNGRIPQVVLCPRCEREQDEYLAWLDTLSPDEV